MNVVPAPALELLVYVSVALAPELSFSWLRPRFFRLHTIIFSIVLVCLK